MKVKIFNAYVKNVKKKADRFSVFFSLPSVFMTLLAVGELSPIIFSSFFIHLSPSFLSFSFIGPVCYPRHKF